MRCSGCSLLHLYAPTCASHLPPARCTTAARHALNSGVWYTGSGCLDGSCVVRVLARRTREGRERSLGGIGKVRWFYAVLDATACLSSAFKIESAALRAAS